jgi:hypothetical protein
MAKSQTAKGQRMKTKNRGCLLFCDVGLKQGLDFQRPRAQHLMALPITKCKAVEQPSNCADASFRCPCFSPVARSTSGLGVVALPHCLILHQYL